MVEQTLEIIAMCLGLVGLIGASATTGLPMWRVTAFIGENIIIMETRWEGLWMNCYRQANVRMQCKVYDSLLILPPDLQAARGLMCSSVALAGLGLLVALAGMRCVSCMRDNHHAKSLILMIGGGMMLLASFCVFIPVSWTGHTIIRDFYNPLLIDAQRRELGEALYIGWVTGGFLFASAVILICRRVPRDTGSFDIYHSKNPTLIGYLPSQQKPTLTGYQPVANSPSFIGNQAAPYNSGLVRNHSTSHNGSFVWNQNPQFNASFIQNQPGPGSFVHQQPSSLSSTFLGNLSTPGNSIYTGQAFTPFYPSHGGQQSTSYNSMYPGFKPQSQKPVFITYHSSTVAPVSPSVSSISEYI